MRVCVCVDVVDAVDDQNDEDGGGEDEEKSDSFLVENRLGSVDRRKNSPNVTARSDTFYEKFASTNAREKAFWWKMDAEEGLRD